MAERDFIAQLCGELSNADRVLWCDWLLENAELDDTTRLQLRLRRCQLAGLLEPGPTPTDTVH